MSALSVVYQFNEKYVLYAGVSITSLFENNKDLDDICVYVLGEGIVESSKETLQKMASNYGRSIVFLPTDDLLEKFKNLGMLPYRGAYSVYLRLFFSDLVGDDVKRAVYIDADTVITGSLKGLLDIDLQDKTIGMVLDSVGNNHKISIGMKESSDYCNTGMILFDLDKWRNRKYQEKIIDHVKNVRAEYPTADQDLLNVVIEGDVYRLPIEYNFQPAHQVYTVKQYFKNYSTKGYYSEEEINYGKSHTCIQHCFRWLGEFPWHEGNLHPFREGFDKYLAISEWKDYKKQKEDKGIVIKIEKILYRILPKGAFLVIFKKAHGMFLKRTEKDARNKKVNQKM